VKQKSLMSHEVRELKLKEQGEELQRTNQLSAAAAERLTQLNDQWTSTNQRLSMYHLLYVTDQLARTTSMYDISGQVVSLKQH